MRASHCSGFSCCISFSNSRSGSVVVERGLWDLPRLGIEPMSPALAGRFFTTEPPGTPQKERLKFKNIKRKQIYINKQKYTSKLNVWGEKYLGAPSDSCVRDLVHTTYFKQIPIFPEASSNAQGRATERRPLIPEAPPGVGN